MGSVRINFLNMVLGGVHNWQCSRAQGNYLFKCEDSEVPRTTTLHQLRVKSDAKLKLRMEHCDTSETELGLLHPSPANNSPEGSI